MVDEQPLIMLQRQIARRLPHMLFDRDMRDSLMLLTFNLRQAEHPRRQQPQRGDLLLQRAERLLQLGKAGVHPAITSYLLIARSYISYNIL